MATIKLGDLTLGNVAIGGSTIGDVRKLSKSNVFRLEAIKNHTIGKTVASACWDITIHDIRSRELIWYILGRE